MKIDRLIGILTVLLQQESITAPKLAERFEVSRRTINRDVENLCKAGIPIETSQGVGGGIRIKDGYRMDRTLLTSKDMQVIMAGLRSLDSVSGSSYYGQLMERIKMGSSSFITGRDSILIDLSSWNKDFIEPKISLIQDAIEKRHEISFVYYAPGGESNRKIEPYYLIFKWSSWYAYGFCKLRNDFRLFKLNRMDKIQMEQSEFLVREVPVLDLSVNNIYPDLIHVEAEFNPEVKWRVVEEYGPYCFEEIENGILLFKGAYTNVESLISWLFTFGDKVKVREPIEVKEELLIRAKNIVKIYEEESLK